MGKKNTKTNKSINIKHVAHKTYTETLEWLCHKAGM